MNPLSIGQFTALDLSLEDFIDNTAANGCPLLSLLVCPPNPQIQLPLVSGENLAAIKTRLDTCGLSVLNVECFMLTAKTEVDTWRAALATGAALGATGATALLYDTDEARVINNLHALCALGREFDLRINIEFLPLSPRWQTLHEAAALIETVAEPNLGLSVDLLHLIRSGGTPADIATVPENLIHCAQICDSNDSSAHNHYAEEAASQRLIPGEGTFPITDFLQALPANTPIEIEVPQRASVTTSEKLSKIVSSTQHQLELAGLK